MQNLKFDMIKMLPILKETLLKTLQLKFKINDMLPYAREMWQYIDAYTNLIRMTSVKL